MITIERHPTKARAVTAKRAYVRAQRIIDRVFAVINPAATIVPPEQTYHVFREADDWVVGCDDPSLPLEDCGE